MLPDFAISGAEGWLILLAPYLLLALVFALVQGARGITGREHHDTGAAASVAIASRTSARTINGLESAVAARSEFERQGAHGSGDGAQVKGFTPPFPYKPGRLVTPSVGDAADVHDVDSLESEARASDIESIEAEIRDALRAKDQAALGELYLRHGAALRVKGETRRAGDVVRKSVMIAMQLKDARLHALGRIELGDIASELGDLTTACEHWQMAKRMFLDIKHRSDTDAADKRMLSHGCPTEWVLNDF